MTKAFRNYRAIGTVGEGFPAGANPRESNSQPNLRHKSLIVYLCIMTLFSSVLFAVEPEDPPAPETEQLVDLLELSLSDLRAVQYALVSTRHSTLLQLSPSPVTVWSAKELRNQSMMNLRQLYRRTPGFAINQHVWEPIISYRGIALDNNMNHLILLDGHNMNHSGVRGMGQRHNVFNLPNFKAVEIMRGPGSTLWGADATLSTTYLKSYDGSDLDLGQNSFGTLRLGGTYEFEENIGMGNLLYGKKFKDDIDLMIASSFSKSSGTALHAHDPGPNGTVRLDELSGIAITPLNHDIYAKLNVHDFSFRGYWLDYEQLFSQATDSNGYSENLLSKHYFVDLRFAPQLSDHVSLEAKASFDNYYNSHLRGSTAPGAPNPRSGEQEWNHKVWTVESIIKHKTDKNTFLLGAGWVLRDYPGTVAIRNSEIAWQTPAYHEDTYSLFAENTLNLLEDWHLTTGIRWDRREDRIEGNFFYPRVALAYVPDGAWAAKYSYNTGVTAPTFTQKWGLKTDSGLFWIGASDAQESRSHDLEFSYTHDNTRFAITLFHTSVDDIIAWVGEDVTLNGVPALLAHSNVADVESMGFELDLEYKIPGLLTFYANYMYADAEYAGLNRTVYPGVIYDPVVAGLATESGRPPVAPAHLWNIGANYLIRQQIHLNLHYRGWADVKVERIQDTYETIGPEHFFDATLVWEDAFTAGLDLSIYCRNLFDNDSLLPRPGTGGGFMESFGVRYGLSATMVFQ